MQKWVSRASQKMEEEEAMEAPRSPEYSSSLSRELEEVITRQNLLTSRTRRRVLGSLQETSQRGEDQEMAQLRQRAIGEIINSEKSYLSQLETINEYFMKPIQESKLLPQNIFANIFGDLLGIHQVNAELLAAMEVSTDQIGKVFLDLAPYLKFYSTYATDFRDASTLVEEWTEKSKPFRQLLANQESRPEVQRKLNSLLITPVQRIPRYKLLLDDIIKNTPRFHPDKDNLQEARTHIDAVAWYINDQIKEHEHSKIMVDIQKSLQGGLPKIIKPGRKLVRQGNLMKVNRTGGGHAQPRYVILFSDMLMYCKFRGGLLNNGTIELPRQDALESCCLLPLKHTMVEQVVGKGVFTIKCQKEQLTLYSGKAEDADWVDTIQTAIRTLKKNSASLQKERRSSMFQPMRKQDMVKMRRESLSKIMLIRKIDEARQEKDKAEKKTRSPLAVLAELSPLGRSSPRRKRDKEDQGAGSPAKLKRVAEEAAENHMAFRPPAEETTPKCLKTTTKKTPVKRIAPTPPRRSPRTPGASTDAAGVVLRKPRVKPNFKTQTRNSLRSLTLGRSVAGLAGIRKPRPTTVHQSSTIFRSPSIYDEPSTRNDAMTTYLSGKIVPLTPSSKPTNVDHLVKKEEVKENTVDDADCIKTYPIAVHDGILNSKKSICTIS
jgi:hypothetical protein